jgi:hypothetical protein
MTLPTLWIAAAFAAGIALATRWPQSLWLSAAIAGILILVRCLLVWRKQTRAASLFALAAWIALGGLALGIERASTPANHIARLIAADRLDLSEPLRWSGRLREDPLVLALGPAI